MKRTGFAVALSVLVLGLWFGTWSRSGGQGQGGPALDNRFCVDSNGDGTVDLSDAVTILNYLFLGQGEPWCIKERMSIEDRLVLDPREVGVDFSALADSLCAGEQFRVLDVRREMAVLQLVSTLTDARILVLKVESPPGMQDTIDLTQDGAIQQFMCNLGGLQLIVEGAAPNLPSALAWCGWVDGNGTIHWVHPVF